MKRLFSLFAVLVFAVSLFAANEDSDKVTLNELVDEMRQMKVTCFAEWSDWRHVNKEKLAVFQKAVSESTMFADNPEIRHNMLSLANGLVSTEVDFEKTTTEYEQVQKQDFTPALLRNKSPEAYRAGRLRAIRSKWSLTQANHSASAQVQISAMQRLANATEEKTIPRSDPLFTAATALEQNNLANKTQADVDANSTQMHLLIVEVLPDGVLARPRDEEEKIRGKIIYETNVIFVLGVEAPVPNRKVVCTAISDGTIQHPKKAAYFEIQRWKAYDTRDETEG